MSTLPRRYDVVVFGSSGFTGKLVCERLSSPPYTGQIKWAMAGRDQAKLERVREELGCTDVPIITADAFDASSVDAMLSDTKVVVSTAGPYAKLGTPIVEGCVRNGTHYCDLTGEVPWVRKMIDSLHEEAVQKKVKIVNCCGYDSVPSDLGTFFLASWVKEKLGVGLGKVEMLVADSMGGVSGGTIDSGVGVVNSMKSHTADISDPYVLTPGTGGPDGKDRYVPYKSELSQAWTIPFIMVSVNTRVVRRTNALMGFRYGKNFQYTEVMKVPGRFSAYLGSAVLLLLGLVVMSPLQKLLLWLLPKSGEGPDRKTQRETGHWVHRFTALTDEATPRKVVAKVTHMHADPGYWSTSCMLLESALCLALQEEELKAAGKPQGGLITPGAAMGELLVDRLKARGLTFDITEAPGKKAQ